MKNENGFSPLSPFSPQPSTVNYILKTPSKINLFLRVIGRKPDGYHEIETVFLPLTDIFDEIEITQGAEEGITISSFSPEIPLDENNLCHKAAARYAEAAGITPSWNIEIIKNIPVTAGMGGGSSDAAATLLSLQQIYDRLTPRQMFDIASGLGADVPYFLNPVASIGRGVGNILAPVNVKRSFSVVICAPQFPVSAAWAYKHLDKKEPSFKLPEVLNALESGNAADVASTLYNDLSFALYRKFPVLEILKNDLIECGALNAEITGSGPTVFGICENIDDAKTIITKINSKHGGAVLCRYSGI